MAGRLVKHERQRPYVLKKDELDDTVVLCACGLSDNKPFCDNSHKQTADEEEDAVYVYDEGKNGIKLINRY